MVNAVEYIYVEGSVIQIKWAEDKIIGTYRPTHTADQCSSNLKTEYYGR